MVECDLCQQPVFTDDNCQQTAVGVICADCCKKHELKKEKDKAPLEGIDNEVNRRLAEHCLQPNNGHTRNGNDRIHEGSGKKRCKTCGRRLPRNFVANHCSDLCARGIHPKDRK